MKKQISILTNILHVIFPLSIRKNKKKSAIGGRKKEIYSKILKTISQKPTPFIGISDYAYVEHTAKISETASVYSGCYIGKNVKIGNRSIIYPNVTIHDNTMIYNDVIIGSGSVIGGEGYGYYLENKTVSIKPVPQIGRTIIHDNVNIGSNVSIDRGTLSDTIIEKGSKINNNVHIAHNVTIGKNCLIMASVSISGSTIIGDNVIINPQAAIAKHLKIGDNSEVGMNSTVIKDVPPNVRVLGSPAKEK